MPCHLQCIRPQTTRLHPAYAAVSIFLQLNLKPAVHISVFQVFLGRPLPLRPCGITVALAWRCDERMVVTI